jgi:hypothetical protein
MKGGCDGITASAGTAAGGHSNLHRGESLSPQLPIQARVRVGVHWSSDGVIFLSLSLNVLLMNSTIE